MFRHLLVPLDGSLQAEHAIPVVAWITRASSSTVIFLRVVEAAPAQDQGQDAERSLFSQARWQAGWEEAHQYLVGIASSHLLADLPVVVSVRQGLLVECIQEAIEAYEADLLVCCNRIEPQDQSPWPGAFAEHLSQRLCIPLLLLPAYELLDSSFAKKNGSMSCLVAFTGWQPEPALLPPAAALLAAFAGRKPGRLHCVTLHALLTLVASTGPEHLAAVGGSGMRRTSPQGQVLLGEVSRLSRVKGYGTWLTCWFWPHRCHRKTGSVYRLCIPLHVS